MYVRKPISLEQRIVGKKQQTLTVKYFQKYESHARLNSCQSKSMLQVDGPNLYLLTQAVGHYAMNAEWRQYETSKENIT